MIKILCAHDGNFFINNTAFNLAGLPQLRGKPCSLPYSWCGIFCWWRPPSCVWPHETRLFEYCPVVSIVRQFQDVIDWVLVDLFHCLNLGLIHVDEGLGTVYDNLEASLLICSFLSNGLISWVRIATFWRVVVTINILIIAKA